MSKIKGKNTKPELLVYRYLRMKKIYFQKHYRTKEKIVLDIALPRKKKAIFVDGDFWHGRTLEKVLLKRNEDDFWVLKLRRNIERDKIQRELLTKNGWRIMTIWESELMKKSSQNEVLENIRIFLKQD